MGVKQRARPPCCQRHSLRAGRARLLQRLVRLRGFIPQVQQTPSCRPRVSLSPIATRASRLSLLAPFQAEEALHREKEGEDRKSTRLNSSHTVISYAVFCLKKKK